MSIEPTYFERDRYDLPLPLAGLHPNIVARETTLLQSESLNLASDQNRAIFQALSAVLTPIGVRFEFSIKRQPQPQKLAADWDRTILQVADAEVQSSAHQLWVRCYSARSLDCQILAEPLATALRTIDLPEFKIAIVKFSSSALGAATNPVHQVADWRLTIDLTPPSVRLKHWARWGDVQAIAKLLNLALAPKEIQISTTLKSLTLQIFCTFKQPQAARSPSKKLVVDTIAPLLIALTPQGIQGATIHGIQSAQHWDESPAWIHWLDLPGLSDPKFSPTPIILAARGDLAALNFILERLLNPDLDQCSAIGGIQLNLMRRHDLIHVMSESPICPIQSQITTTVVKVIQQLALPGVRGLRIHGRISGQSAPQWTYGLDFDRAPLALPPVAVEHQFTTAQPVPQISLVEKVSQYLLKTGIWSPQFGLGNNHHQLVYEPRFRWEPSLLLLLVGIGFVATGDLVIRANLERRNIGTESTAVVTQLSFNNSLLEQKLAQYQLRCSTVGVPDILIVGSSRALRGVDPAVLKSNLIGTNPQLQVYNFGINGATAQVVDLILRQLLKTEELPKMVIWADGARAFNSGRIDRTYETIVLSDRYRKLAPSLKLKNSTHPLFQIQSAVQTTYQSIDIAIDTQLAEISPAYSQRDLLKDKLRTRLPVTPQLANPNHSTTSNDPATSINERDVNNDGFLPLKLQFDPTTYYQKYTKVFGDSDGDYANFQLQGHQDLALQQTIDFLATQKIPLVFVDLPLTDIYLDKLRRQHELTFTTYMHKMMDAQRLTFVNMNGLLAKRYDRFSDPSHLNQAGAVDVSEYLTQIPEIRSSVKH